MQMKLASQIKKNLKERKDNIRYKFMNAEIQFNVCKQKSRKVDFKSNSSYSIMLELLKSFKYRSPLPETGPVTHLYKVKKHAVLNQLRQAFSL